MAVINRLPKESEVCVLTSRKMPPERVVIHRCSYSIRETVFDLVQFSFKRRFFLA